MMRDQMMREVSQIVRCKSFCLIFRGLDLSLYSLFFLVAFTLPLVSKRYCSYSYCSLTQTVFVFEIKFCRR